MPGERKVIKGRPWVLPPQLRRKFVDAEYDIEIIDISQTDNLVEIYARAWTTDGVQIGFGPGGFIDIERFRIHNPPSLIPDNGGEVTKEVTVRAGVKEQRRFHYDPHEAILQVLVNTIRIVGTQNSPVIPESVGRTTSVFRPLDSTGSGTSDSSMFEDRYNSWATTIAATACRINYQTAFNIDNSIGNGNGAGYYSCLRYGCTIDTSSIPDSDIISSATFSIRGISKLIVGSEQRAYLVSFNPADTDSFNTDDYDQLGSTSYGSTPSTWDSAGWNDVTLNATGLSAISKTSLSKFGFRGYYDINASAPDNSNEFSISGYAADEAGTTNDPYLTVVHASGSASLSPSASPSTSPSQSPSASFSPSTSPSKSPSLSPSTSPSQSPSASLSPSRSPSLSPSSSPSQSPSASVSPSPSPGGYVIDYVSEDYALELGSYVGWTDADTVQYVGTTFVNNDEMAKLKSALFFVYPLAGNDGYAYAKVYQGDDGTPGTNIGPDGGLIATSDPVDVGALPAQWNATTFTFSNENQIVIYPGKHYAIYIEYVPTNIGGLNALLLRRVSKNDATTNVFYTQFDPPALPTWYASPNTIAFYIYGEGVWEYGAKTASAWSGGAKNASTWTNGAKNSSTWTNGTKDITSWAEGTKSSTPWTLPYK